MVFFTNSGTEAVECALKTARRYHASKGDAERIDVIGFDGSFHGRSYAAVNASGNAGYLEGFGPRLPGYRAGAVRRPRRARGDDGADDGRRHHRARAGRGRRQALNAAELDRLRAMCDEAGALLIYDEIQCGLGRTGRLFAYEWAENAAPDIMCIAKALGGGFPVGACLATAEAAKGMTVGSHGSTYGGNPLAMAVGLAAFEELTKPELLAHVRDVAGYFGQQLAGLKDRYPDVISEIRGHGLLIGLKLIPNNREFMVLARDEKLLIAGGGDNCVRLLPPLIISQAEAREAVQKLERALRGGAGQGAGVSDRRRMPPRHFIDLWDVEAGALRAILDDAKARKAARAGRPKGARDDDQPARDCTLAMIFEKNSTRTWFSFDAAIRQLGGHAIIATSADMQLGRGETVEDTARVLSRMVDLVMIRSRTQETQVRFAAAASVPLINGLSDKGHPCQIVTDLMTFEEHRGPVTGRTLAWIGDGNNMCASFIQAAAKLDFRLTIACPPAYAPASDELARAQAAGAAIEVTDDPRAAVRGADAVMTDTWISMGDTDAEARAEGAWPLPGRRGADGAGRARRGLPPLPARAPRRGDDRRRHRRPAVDRLGRGGKPHPRPEGDHRLVPRRGGLAGALGLLRLPLLARQPEQKHVVEGAVREHVAADAALFAAAEQGGVADDGGVCLETADVVLLQPHLVERVAQDDPLGLERVALAAMLGREPGPSSRTCRCGDRRRRG